MKNGKRKEKNMEEMTNAEFEMLVETLICILEESENGKEKALDILKKFRKKEDANS